MIFGLIGYKGSGKSTVAEYLNKKYDFQRIAFADPLKTIAKIFGFTEKQLYGSQEDKLEIHKQLGICSREFMQKFGTDVCRNQLLSVFPNMKLGKSGSIWVKLMENYIENNQGIDICCEDVRFPDELELIRDCPNSIIIEIIRKEECKDEYSAHVSETSLPNTVIVDFQIINDGSMEELYETIDEIVSTIKNESFL